MLIALIFLLLLFGLEKFSLVRLHFLLLAQLAEVVLEQVDELLLFVVRADQVHARALLRMEHALLVLAPEVDGGGRAKGLWGRVGDVGHGGEVALVAGLCVAHPLLNILVANSTLLNELDNNIPHELLCLVNQQAEAIMVDLLQAIARLYQVHFVDQILRLQEGTFSTLDKVTLPVLQDRLRILIIVVIVFVRVVAGHVLLLIDLIMRSLLILLRGYLILARRVMDLLGLAILLLFRLLLLLLDLLVLPVLLLRLRLLLFLLNLALSLLLVLVLLVPVLVLLHHLLVGALRRTVNVAQRVLLCDAKDVTATRVVTLLHLKGLSVRRITSILSCLWLLRLGARLHHVLLFTIFFVVVFGLT